MAAFAFPNSDALRLALVSGIIPDDLAAEEIAAQIDNHGVIWLENDSLSRETVIALQRIGARLQLPPIDLQWQVFCCWAAILPLRQQLEPTADSHLLLQLPADQLPRLLAECRRLNAGVLRFRMEAGEALVQIENAGFYLLKSWQDREGWTLYHEVSPAIWVRLGFEHPLSPLGLPALTDFVLIRPDQPWQRHTGTDWHRASGSFQLEPVVPSAAPRFPALPRVELSWQLRPQSNPDAPLGLWLFEGTEQEWQRFLMESDHRQLRDLGYAQFRSSSGLRMLMKPLKRKAKPLLDPRLQAFQPHPLCPALFLPVNQILLPKLRQESLQKLLQLRSDEVAWMCNSATGLQLERLRLDEFRPFESLITVTAPGLQAASQRVHSRSWLELPEFELETPVRQRTIPETVYQGQPARAESQQSGPGWFSRLTGKLFRGKSAALETPVYPAGGSAVVATPGARAIEASKALPVNEWAARRLVLEEQLAEPATGHSAATRAQLWAELAGILSETGNPMESALCWILALWHSPKLECPTVWFTNWLRAEMRAGGLGLEKLSIETLRQRSPSPAVSRIAAVMALSQALQTPSNSNDQLAELVQLAESTNQELPIRLEWMLNVAMAQRSQGDPLRLARTRDRLFQRMDVHGLALDLDAPTFLRFRNGLERSRFQEARDWLHRTRETMQKWLGKHKPTTQQGWTGLDPDLTATAAYADLMLAWGHSKLGDRQRSRELIQQARHALAKPPRPSVDPRVHADLQQWFEQRIRSVGEGRDTPESSSDSPLKPLKLELSEYTLERLASRSRILRPTRDEQGPFRISELAWFLGEDPLGVLLHQCSRLENPAEWQANCDEILTELERDPTALILPRAVLTLASHPRRLSKELAQKVVAWAIPAFEMLPESIRMLSRPERDPTPANARLITRLINDIAQLALHHQLNEPLSEFLDTILRGVRPGSITSQALPRSARVLFETFKELKMRREVTRLLNVASAKNRERKVLSAEDYREFTLGWFIVGDLETGTRWLDDCREELFVRGVATERERTDLALAYAVALRHAPPRLAQGRLEELFQRLDRISTASATSRYFALKPLELIDTAITSVISEEFSLSPQVRSWLDDEEFVLRKRIQTDLHEALGQKS